MRGKSGKLCRARLCGVLSLLIALFLAQGAQAYIPSSKPSAAPVIAPGAAKKKPVRQAAVAPPQSEAPAAPGAALTPLPEEALGDLEELPATATLWLQSPAEPENIQQLALDDDLVVAGRIRIGEAEVYILEWAPRRDADLPIMSLEEAKAKGLVELREISEEERQSFSGYVSPGAGGLVVARNQGDVYVMVVGGEVLCGGNQDRMVSSSAILPPKSGWIPLPVHCVEKGRSRGADSAFDLGGPGGALAHPLMRVRSLCQINQEAVWAEASRMNRLQGTSNPTQSYRGALGGGRDFAKTRQAAENVMKALEAYPRAVGVAFALRGEVISFERYGSAALFRAQARSLLRAQFLNLAAMGERKVADGAAFRGRPNKETSAGDVAAFYRAAQGLERVRPVNNHQGIGTVLRGDSVWGGEIRTDLAPRDPALRGFAPDLARSGPVPAVLYQWATKI